MKKLMGYISGETSVGNSVNESGASSFRTQATEDANSYFMQGKEYFYEQKKTTEAIACFDKAIGLKPNFPAAYTEKANALRFLGNTQAALECLEQAVKGDANYAPAYYQLVRVFCALGRTQDAEKCFHQAEKLPQKSDAEWSRAQGAALIALGKHGEAIKSYDKAIQLKPDDFGAYVNKGNALGDLGKNAEAIKCYDKAIELKPDDAEAYRNKGNTLIALGKLEEAIKCYDKAIELKPDDFGAYTNKGVVLSALGKHEEAIKCYDKAIELKPDDAFAYNNKGRALSDLGKKEEAIKYYDKVIELKPEDAFAYSNKGAALSALGKKEEAIKCYDKVIELKPDNAEAYRNKGNALNALGKKEEAIKCYDKAIQLKPYEYAAYVNKGNALGDLGKNVEAIKYYDKAIELKPDDAEAYRNKGHTLIALGKLEEAIKCYDKAIQLKPDDFGAYTNKGVVLSALGKHEEAIKCYDKAIEIKPYDALAYNNKGRALSALGKHEEAIKCYDKAIQLKPDDALVYVNKGQTLNALGREQEALDCFNKAYELSKSGKLGENLSGVNISYINQVLSQDREVLLKKLTELQKASISAEKALAQLDQNNAVVKKATEQFKSLKKASNKITDATIESFDKGVTSGEVNHLSNESLLKQLSDQQAQMDLFMQQLNELKQENKHLKAAQAEILTGVSEVKEQQKKHSERLEKLEASHKVAQELLVKIQNDIGIKDADKAVMQKSIESLTKKMDNFADKKDLETITQSVTELIVQGKITKGKLMDLEEEVDNILEQQQKQQKDGDDSTTVYMLNNVRYENVLLNHPELIRSVLNAEQVKSKSLKFSQVLDLFAKLDQALVTEAINDNNVDILLGGLMSLESVSYDVVI